MCLLHTANIHVRDHNALDITVKSASTPEGYAFAPTWKMVMDYKKGALSESGYEAQYRQLLRNRYKADPTPFLNILAQKRVVLQCYCPAETFCHRHIAIAILKQIAQHHGLEATNGGEIRQGKRTPRQEEML